MALFGHTFDAAAKARIAAYEATVQAAAVELDIDLGAPDEDCEEFVSADRTDAKGREIGFIVGLKVVDGTQYAWVQNARRVDGVVSDFGTLQRSRPFGSHAQAESWAKRTAAERIANLK